MASNARKTAAAGSLREELTAERAKLAGIAAGATANASDDALRDRDSHTGEQAIATVTGLQDALDGKAPLASPALSGTPTAPTPSAGTNTTQIATTAYVRTAVADLVDSSPGALDTLNELAAALGDDPNFATTVTNQIAEKEPGITAGTASQFWRGDKSWRDFATDVRASVLTGLSTATNAAIAATDTVLAAVGKLQAQVTAFGALASSSVQPADPVSDLSETSTAKIMTGDERAKLGALPDNAGLTASLAAKFDKAGGTVTGDILLSRVNNPRIEINALDDSAAYLRLRNTTGFFDIAATWQGQLVINNYNADDTYQNTPFLFENDGTPVFNSRPYYGGVSDDARLITYSEATALVGGGGGGGGTIISVFGRSGPLIDAQSGDYNSSQITHGGGSVSSALAALDSGKQQVLSAVDGFELGIELTGDRNSLIDFHSYGAPAAVDFSARIHREPGVNGDLSITQTGTGNIILGGGSGIYYNGVAMATEFDTLSGGTF